MVKQKLECQIYALEKQLKNGNPSNIFALKNKIANLKQKLQQLKQVEQWNEFLAK